MSRNYDNWERLVAAVIKREEDWQLCHQLSIKTPSISSQASSSDLGSGFGSSSDYFQVSDDYMFEIDNNRGSDQKPVPKLIPVEGVLKRTRQLGKGTFGTSTLVQLQRRVQVSQHEFLAEGTQLVMKQLRSEVLKVAEEGFGTVFGNCRHKNVAVPRAYYFSSKENFIFNDYHRQGSVYDLLHGKDSRLNWESCVKIAVGTARCIAHIHGQYGGKLAHGNVKSSNIFLNSERYGCVSDFGLAAINKSPGKKPFAISRASVHEHESKVKNASPESDTYAFGVVLLQLLLWKSPRGFWDDVRLVKWAHSAAPEDWSSEWFGDERLWRSKLYKGILCDEIDKLHYEAEVKLERKVKAEKMEMLEVAMKCFAALPQDRPKMFEVVWMLENITEQQTQSHVEEISRWELNEFY